jgi:hypothetical protein
VPGGAGEQSKDIAARLSSCGEARTVCMMNRAQVNPRSISDEDVERVMSQDARGEAEGRDALVDAVDRPTRPGTSQSLNPPDAAVVLCVDEKSQIRRWTAVPRFCR